LRDGQPGVGAKGGAVMKVHRITKFGLKKERPNNRGFKVLIIHRRAERF
jgi:hypothetical protein